MYCSTCGHQIADHLNYCNSCGARIEKNPLVVTNASSPYLAKALAVTVMIGFVGFIAVLKIVLDNGRLDVPGMVLICLGYLTALTLISAMIIGHMWKTSGDIRIRSKKPSAADDYHPPRSFRGSNTNQLQEPSDAPIGSVTDSTTRTLEKAYFDARK